MSRENEEMLNVMWCIAAVGSDVETSILRDSDFAGA